MRKRLHQSSKSKASRESESVNRRGKLYDNCAIFLRASGEPMPSLMKRTKQTRAASGPPAMGASVMAGYSSGQLQIPPPVPLPTKAPHWVCR
jgi:hypothetical protein